MRSAEELKVYAIGGRHVVFVRASQVEGLGVTWIRGGFFPRQGDPRGWGLTGWNWIGTPTSEKSRRWWTAGLARPNEPKEQSCNGL